MLDTSPPNLIPTFMAASAPPPDPFKPQPYQPVNPNAFTGHSQQGQGGSDLMAQLLKKPTSPTDAAGTTDAATTGATGAADAGVEAGAEAGADAGAGAGLIGDLFAGSSDLASMLPLLFAV
jgi:hypothetical protein